MNSKRLPGKVMMKIAGQPMIWYVVKRVEAVKRIAKVVVATSKEKSDDSIALFCKKNKIQCFRGNLENVLDRYYKAAKKFNADIIVRVTADCPLIDGNLVKKALKLFKIAKPDYLSNTIVRTYPRGFDLEIFTFESLKEAFKQAENNDELEHVTPYIWKHPGRFRLSNMRQKTDDSKFRVTVDEKEDFLLVKRLIEEYGANKMSYLKITNLLKLFPELYSINQGVVQKEI